MQMQYICVTKRGVSTLEKKIHCITSTLWITSTFDGFFLWCRKKKYYFRHHHSRRYSMDALINKTRQDRNKIKYTVTSLFIKKKHSHRLFLWFFSKIFFFFFILVDAVFSHIYHIYTCVSMDHLSHFSYNDYLCHHVVNGSMNKS